MNRLTTICVALALLGGVAGCGGSGPPYKYSAQQRAAAQSDCESAVREVRKEGLVGVAEHAAEECQCYMPLRETKVPASKATVAGDVLSDPACVFNEHTNATTHTPEEEAAHNKSLETQRRGEEQETDAQKKVEEDENRGGEHSIRRSEEKVCYESGKSAQECEGPLKETPEEERSEAENKARQQQSQEESTGQPAVVE